MEINERIDMYLNDFGQIKFKEEFREGLTTLTELAEVTAKKGGIFPSSLTPEERMRELLTNSLNISQQELTEQEGEALLNFMENAKCIYAHLSAKSMMADNPDVFVPEEETFLRFIFNIEFYLINKMVGKNTSRLITSTVVALSEKSDDPVKFKYIELFKELNNMYNSSDYIIEKDEDISSLAQVDVLLVSNSLLFL